MPSPAPDAPAWPQKGSRVWLLPSPANRAAVVARQGVVVRVQVHEGLPTIVEVHHDNGYISWRRVDMLAPLDAIPWWRVAWWSLVSRWNGLVRRLTH